MSPATAPAHATAQGRPDAAHRGTRRGLAARLLRGPLGAAWLLALLGCGLADYEARISSEKARLEHFDVEEQYLEGPVVIPAREKGAGRDQAARQKGPEYAEVFFRPPRGINTRPDDKHAYGELYYRYSRRPNVRTPIVEVALAALRDPKDEYVKELLQPFPGIGAVASTRRMIQRHWREPLQVETRVVDDTYFNYHQRGDYRVAVVFRIDRGRATGDLNKMMDLSLASLAIGADASKARMAFRQRLDNASAISTPAGE